MNIRLALVHRLILYFYLSLLVISVAAIAIVDKEWTWSAKTVASSFAVSAFFVALCAAHYFAAVGATKGETWGRTLSRIIAVPLLFGFPVGTIIACCIFNWTGKQWQSKGSVEPIPLTR